MAHIAIATYSVRNSLKDPSIGLDGIIKYMKDLGIKHVEINNMFFSPETLVETAQKFKDAGITPIQLTIDGNNFFQKKPAKRKEQFEFMKKWVDPAAEAGLEFIRANMGHKAGFLFPTDTLENIVATFKPILEYIESKGMKFVFENHGGKSSDVDFQLKVKENFPTKNFGYLLDFGNYRPKDSVYENIIKLKDAILIAHAKTYDFDENGEETTLDVGKIVENLRKVGFDGYYSIEYEGHNIGDLEGTEKTKLLLEKYI